MEGLARVANPVLPEWTAQSGEGSAVMSGHPTRLWGNHADGVRQNGGATATINALGLRGPVCGPRQGERLMVLGDSTAFGHGVEDGQPYVDVAGEALRARGIEVDTVNGAVAGYSIAQTRILMDEVGWSLDPTLLVISNLWSDNTFDAFHDEDLLASARMRAMNPLAHSAALRLLASALGSPGTGRVITVSRLAPWPEGTVRRVPLERYAALMEGLVQQARERGVGVVFVRNANVHIAQGPLPGGPAIWQPYFQVMEALAEHHGVPLVEVSSVFGGRTELFLDLMHPTAEGHRLIGQELASALVAADWPSERLLGNAAPFSTELRDLPWPTNQDDSGAGSPQRRLFE